MIASMKSKAQKLRVGIVLGGQSAEHSVSLSSTRNILAALDRDRFEPELIGIAQTGQYLAHDVALKQLESGCEHFDVNGANPRRSDLLRCEVDHIDVLFPVLHGPYGEDGTIQGFAKFLNIPCVGSGVIGSALGMDKEVMKRLLEHAGIPIVSYVTVRRSDDGYPEFEQLRKRLGELMFIKPANMGSSVGISRVETQRELRDAIELAFRYDTKVLIERGLDKPREIEIGILGNEQPELSVIGELSVADSFYSFEAKYSPKSQTTMQIPAALKESVRSQISGLALQAFRALECRGMARVDFFVQDDTVYLNEINTIPGFTNSSMYPKLWEATGVQQTELISRLIDLAIEEFNQHSSLA